MLKGCSEAVRIPYQQHPKQRYEECLTKHLAAILLLTFESHSLSCVSHGAGHHVEMKLKTGADRRQRSNGGSMIYLRTSPLLSPVSQIYSTEDMGADPAWDDRYALSSLPCY